MEAERERPRKRSRRYTGTSDRTLRRRRTHREDLAKQGYLSVFEFMAHVEKTTNKRPHTERLTARPDESESAPEESDTEDVVFKGMGQVRVMEPLTH